MSGQQKPSGGVDLTGKKFTSPNHAPVLWTVVRYHRGGAWVCREAAFKTTMEFYGKDIEANIERNAKDRRKLRTTIRRFMRKTESQTPATDAATKYREQLLKAGVAPEDHVLFALNSR